MGRLDRTQCGTETVEGCYEICILNGVPLNDSLCERLGQLMKDGHHAGI